MLDLFLLWTGGGGLVLLKSVFENSSLSFRVSRVFQLFWLFGFLVSQIPYSGPSHCDWLLPWVLSCKV